MGLRTWLAGRRKWRADHEASFTIALQVQADGLTLFQHQALAALASAVPTERFISRKVEKDPIQCLAAPIGNAGAELCIYANEATIFGAKPNAWFEEWDYRTADELLQALVKECIARAA